MASYPNLSKSSVSGEYVAHKDGAPYRVFRPNPKARKGWKAVRVTLSTLPIQNVFVADTLSDISRFFSLDNTVKA